MQDNKVNTHQITAINNKTYEKPQKFCLIMPDNESNFLGQKLIIKHGPFDGI